MNLFSALRSRLFAEPQAPTNEPPKEPTRAEFVAGLSEVVNVNAFGGRGTWDQFLGGNPAASLSSISPKSSTSAALGLVYVQDAAYYDLMDEFENRDPTVSSSIDILKGIVCGKERKFEPVEEDGERGVSVAKACEEYLSASRGSFSFGSMIDNLIRGTIKHGFSVCEIMWTLKDGLLVPWSYPHRHPGTFAFDVNGALHVLDGSSTLHTPAPLFRFVVARSNAMYGNPYGESVIDTVRFQTYFKHQIIKRMVDLGTTWGSPIAIGKIGGASGDRTNTAQAKSALKRIIEELPRTFGAVLTNGDTLEFTPRDGGKGGALPHKDMIDYFAGQQMIRIIGSTLAVAEAQYGSRAQADTHGETTNNAKVRPLAKLVSDVIVRDVVTPFVRLNFGPDVPVPAFVIDVDSKTDVELALRIVDACERNDIPMTIAQVQEWLGIMPPVEGQPLVGNRAGGDVGRIYQYHIQSGVVTVNEVRATLNLPPIDGGDVPAAMPVGSSGGAIFGESESARIVRMAEEAGRTAEKKVKARHARAIDVMDAAADNAASAVVLGTTKNMRAAIAKLRRDGVDGDMPVFDAGDIAKEFADSFEANGLKASIKSALSVAVATAALVTAEDFSIAKKRKNASPGAKIVKVFAEADDIARDAAKAAGLGESVRDAMAEALDILGSGNASVIGTRTLAIEKLIGDEAGKRFKDLLRSASDNGKTVGEFLDDVDELLGDDTLPGGLDSYLNMVFRTEMGNEYANQRDAYEALPEVAETLWGYEFFNPSDDRSRSSHAAVDGLRVKRGGAADMASRPGPPWSYQCRCERLPLIAASIEDGDALYQEDDDALAILSNLERF